MDLRPSIRQLDLCPFLFGGIARAMALLDAASGRHGMLWALRHLSVCGVVYYTERKGEHRPRAPKQIIGLRRRSDRRRSRRNPGPRQQGRGERKSSDKGPSASTWAPNLFLGVSPHKSPQSWVFERPGAGKGLCARDRSARSGQTYSGSRPRLGPRVRDREMMTSRPHSHSVRQGDRPRAHSTRGPPTDPQSARAYAAS